MQNEILKFWKNTHIYIYFFFVAGNEVKKLEYLCKKVLVNAVPFPHYLRELPIPNTMIEELVHAYPSLIEFPPVNIAIWAKEADEYFGFEQKIKYSIPFSKRFFSVIKGTAWVRKYFGISPTVTKHIVERTFVCFTRVDIEKLPSLCTRCYVNSEFYPSANHHIETKHYVFKGTPDQLFEKIFSGHMWCTRCKRSPIFDIYDPDDCVKKYGHFAHYCCEPGFGCFSCSAGGRLSKIWYEEQIDVVDYTY